MEKEYSPTSFKKGSLVSTIVGLVEAAILLAVGVVCIACCNQSWLKDGVFLAVGIIVTLFGLTKLTLNAIPVFRAKSLSDEQRLLFKAYFGTDMIMSGAIQLIVGLLLIVVFAVNPGLLDSIMSFFGYAVSISMFVLGGTLIVFSTGFLISKVLKTFTCVVYYVISAILIGLGVLVIVFLSSGSNFTIVILITTGVILVLFGIATLIVTIKDAVEAKREAKANKEAVDVVEVKVVDKKKTDLIEEKEESKSIEAE